MKVKELQKSLSAIDPEAEVLCYTEDENLLAKGMGFRILDIEAVDITHGEFTRLDDETPYLKLEKSEKSQAIVTLTVTGIF